MGNPAVTTVVLLDVRAAVPQLHPGTYHFHAEHGPGLTERIVFERPRGDGVDAVVKEMMEGGLDPPQGTTSKCAVWPAEDCGACGRRGEPVVSWLAHFEKG